MIGAFEEVPGEGQAARLDFGEAREAGADFGKEFLRKVDAAKCDIDKAGAILRVDHLADFGRR